MYRGQPPNGRLFSLATELQQSLLKGSKYTGAFNSLKWVAGNEDHVSKFTAKGEVKVRLSSTRTRLDTGGWDRSTRDLAPLRISSKSGNEVRLTDSKDFSFEEASMPNISFEIERSHRESDCFCFKFTRLKTAGASINGLDVEELLEGEEDEECVQVTFRHQLYGKKKSFIEVTKLIFSLKKFDMAIYILF